MSTQPRFVAGLSVVIDDYDAVILDLWGVVHDGQRPYPGVPECIRALQAAGKTICLLSNAPRRLTPTAARLDGMGLTADYYDMLMTSGEATHQALKNPPDDWHSGLGHRLLHIGPPRDRDVFESLDDRTEVFDPAQADFVLNSGIDDDHESLADYQPLLRECARRKLPMLCANPDLIVHLGEALVICAGTLAEHYAELGGPVRYHGKPWPGVYQECLRRLGNPAPDRVLAVGDSLRTDIAGAAGMQMDSVLITGGIHRQELGDNPTPQQVTALLAAYPHPPTYLLPRLAW